MMGIRLPLARLSAHAWWVVPALLILVLCIAQGVPDVRAYALRGAALSHCDDSGLSKAARWAPSLRDRHLSCLVAEYRANLTEDGIRAYRHALLIEGVHQDVAIDLNGVRIRDVLTSGRRTHRLEPILVPIGSGLLLPGENVVRMQLLAADTLDAPVLFRAAYLGPADPLEAWYRRHLLLQEGAARMTLVVMGLLLILLLPIAVAGPRNPQLRWYALAMLLAAIYVSVFASTWRPMPSHYWQTIGLIALALALAAFIRMSELELGERRRSRPIVLCVAAGILWGANSWVLAPLDRVADGAGRVILLVLLLDLGWRWWRRREAKRLPDPRWTVGGVALLLVLGLSDSLEANLRSDWPAIAFLLHWGILYLLALMFVALIVRQLDALRTAEDAQHRLGAALAERTRELTAEFALRREAETARMLAEERQRIMRDMHDGVGGQLVALMTQVRTGATDPETLASELRRTLDDLRLMIDSLDPACADLSVALGMLRRRSEGLVGAQGPAIEWRTAHLPDLPPLPPATVLHVLRIVQEALGNALKHAHARRLTVEAAWDGMRVTIAVVDDGLGGVREGGGRGLVHLRERAAAIGARLAIDSGPGGTRVLLHLRISPAGRAPGTPPVSG